MKTRVLCLLMSVLPAFALAGVNKTHNDSDNPEQQKTGQIELPDGILKLEVGPVWTTSKMYLNENNYKSGMMGVGVAMSYTHMVTKNIGVGLSFSGSRTTVDFGPSYGGYGSYYSSNNTGADVTYTMLYGGPSVSFAGWLADRIRADYSIGVGLAHYKDDGMTKAGLGICYSIGFEIAVSKRVGLGIEVARQISFFKKPENINIPNNEHYGFDHIGMLVGMRLYY